MSGMGNVRGKEVGCSLPYLYTRHTVYQMDFVPWDPLLALCMKNYSNDKGLTRNPFLSVKNGDKTVPK